MAATSQGIVGLHERIATDFNKKSGRSSLRTRGGVQSRGFVMIPSSRSFRAFRMIKKSPRLNRSTSRVVMRISSTTVSSMVDYNERRGGDVTRNFDDDDDDNDRAGGAAAEGSDSSTMVDTVNAVLADIVDGQKYIKETGRTKARPMKRRALVVSLALGAFRGPLDAVDSRLGSLRRTASASRLARTPSSKGFARTAHLISQLSFGSPHAADVH